MNVPLFLPYIKYDNIKTFILNIYLYKDLVALKFKNFIDVILKMSFILILNLYCHKNLFFCPF